jgi:CDP-6-deoxy-D-xylo-4-hexulose-3-dehydrase
MSNFSFYYAHHMTTIEGGMISTDDEQLYQTLRMLRGHGMVREASSPALRQRYHDQHPDLNPDFIFAYPAYNVRSTEINAVLGRSQLRRLDEANRRRTENLRRFLDGLDPAKYRTDFAVEGSSNYAFTLIQREPDAVLSRNLMATLRQHRVEFRRGTSGGGNQLRQPYLRALLGDEYARYPHTEHVHFYGYYIGNYPGLEADRIQALCRLVNAVPAGGEGPP